MSWLSKAFREVKRVFSDAGGILESVLDPGAATARAVKQGQRRAERQAEQLRQQEEAQALASRRRREQALRSALAPSPSLFDVLGSSQQGRGTLG